MTNHPMYDKGYATYPHLFGKPTGASTDEIQWCRGWTQAQREDLAQADWSKEMRDDGLWGRDSYAADYKPQQMELTF